MGAAFIVVARCQRELTEPVHDTGRISVSKLCASTIYSSQCVVLTCKTSIRVSGNTWRYRHGLILQLARCCQPREPLYIRSGRTYSRRWQRSSRADCRSKFVQLFVFSYYQIERLLMIPIYILSAIV